MCGWNCRHDRSSKSTYHLSEGSRWLCQSEYLWSALFLWARSCWKSFLWFLPNPKACLLSKRQRYPHFQKFWSWWDYQRILRYSEMTIVRESDQILGLTESLLLTWILPLLKASPEPCWIGCVVLFQSRAKSRWCLQSYLHMYLFFSHLPPFPNSSDSSSL